MTDKLLPAPVAAYTIDYTGCDHMSRDIANIERIAAAGSKGPTPVVYLYEGIPPVDHVAARLLALSKVGFGYDIKDADREALKDAAAILSTTPVQEMSVDQARVSGFAEGIERAAKIADEHAADFERQADGKEDPHAHDALLLAADACELTADAIRSVMGGNNNG